MQPFQCDLQPQIPKLPITTHTQAQPKQLEATVTMRQKKKANRPQPQPPHTGGTFHRRLQPLYTEKYKVSCSWLPPQNKAHATFMQPFQCVLQHPVANLHMATRDDNNHAGQFFCDVLLCSVKSHTALHQGQFFCDVLLCDVKSHTALHQGQFFCDVLLCDVKSHTALHQGQLFCDVLLCDAKSHTTLHQGQFHQLKVIRNSEVLFPNFL